LKHCYQLLIGPRAMPIKLDLLDEFWKPKNSI
jgi:hypothetical protein